MPPFAPGMATQHAPSAQGHAAPCAMPLQCLQRVGRACGFEAAGVPEPGLQPQAITANQQHQGIAWRVENPAGLHGRAGCPGLLPARTSSCSSSLRAVAARVSDRAETKLVTGNGMRRRTSHWPAGNAPACAATWAAKTLRICRFNRLRVTARRACRLGTTQPNQCPTGRSSTGTASDEAPPVDKSVPKLGTAVLATGFRAGKGPCAR